MNNTYILSLSAWLDKFTPSLKDNLLNYLEDEIKEQIKALTFTPQLPLSSLFLEKGIPNIHYSWLKEPLMGYSKEDQSFFLNSLDPSQKEGLIKQYNLDCVEMCLSSVAQNFFRLTFFTNYFRLESTTIKEFLKPTTWSFLLDLPKSQLVLLIDLLGLEDLSFDAKKCLDKKILDEIVKQLTSKQQSYFFAALKRQPLPSFQTEKIQFWLQPKERLAILLQQKGILRLAIALSDQEEGFIWHLSRLLDIGRGTELINNIKKIKDNPLTLKLRPLLSPLIVNQIRIIQEGKL